MNASTPFLAESILLPLIEPVRSSTIITSRGLAPHGEQACAETVSRIEPMPIRPRKLVGTSVLSVTCTVLAGLQNFALVEQSVVAAVVTSPDPLTGFSPCSDEL